MYACIVNIHTYMYRYINTCARDRYGRACGCTASHAHVRAIARIIYIYIYMRDIYIYIYTCMYMFYVCMYRHINTCARDGYGRACGCTASQAHVRAIARIIYIYIYMRDIYILYIYMYVFYVWMHRHITTCARDGCRRACGCTASHAHVRAIARIICIYV